MPTRKAEYRVANLDCDRDAAAMERGLRSVPGVLDLEVYRQAAKVSVQYDPDRASPKAIAEKLDKLGFPAERGRVEAQWPRPLRNPKVLASITSGVLLLGGWLVSLVGAPHWATFAVYVAAILIGGYYFGCEAIEELTFEHEVGIELLMSLAAVTATVMGAAGEGGSVLPITEIVVDPTPLPVPSSKTDLTGHRKPARSRAICRYFARTTLVSAALGRTAALPDLQVLLRAAPAGPAAALP